MTDLRIADAPELTAAEVNDTLKVPTGGYGNYSVTMITIRDWLLNYKMFATQSYVDTQVGVVTTTLNNHASRIDNPHQVTKTQVGLGNVDNTSDVNKPISSATQTALTNLNTSLTSAISVKANSADVYTKSEVYTKVESDNKYHQKLSIDGILAPTAVFDDVKNLDGVNGAPDSIINQPIQNLANRTEFLKSHNNLVGRDSTNAHPSSSILDSSGQTQQQINDAQEIINNVVNKLDGDFVFVEHYYAKGGALRPVSDLYTVGSDVYNSQFTDFSSVQTYYPHVTATTDPLDWAATQKAVNENYSVRFRDVFYYFGTKTLEIPTACSQLLGQGILTRIYSDASIAIKAKTGFRVVGGLYGDFYLLGSSVASSIGFDASAFSYNTFRNMYIRLFNDGWYADGSITPVNKQYSNNTVINVRSNNNLRDGFRLVGSSVANSANTYVGCEAAGNANIGFNETVGYSNQTVGCTFQGNTVFDFYSDGERNIHEYYTEGNPKSSKLGSLSKNNFVSIRSSYPLWNSFINDGQANNVSVRGDISIDHHVFSNPYFEDWSGSSPSNVLANGAVAFSYYSDANTRLGGGLQAVFNANFQGIILQNLDPTIDYAGRWVTVQIEADTSGVTDLSGLRVYTRDGSTNNGATGEFAATSWTQTTAGKYKNFTLDVKFAATLASTPTVLIYLAYSGITTTNTIKIKSIKLILGQKDRVSEYALSRPTRSAVAANFTSATSGLNTAFKYSGKVVFNSTASKAYYATGTSPTSAWKAFDGTADIVPS